ncbi:MAG: hypothetical protein ACKVS6_16485 [Planctomycetota bacterium]
MRTIASTLVTFLIAGWAQEPGRVSTSRPSSILTQEQLQQKLDAKLASEFLTKAPWLTDYDAARIEAKKTEKLIFAYFTKSDVDFAGCRVLESGPFLDPRFAQFGESFILYCHITSGVASRKYESLFKEKMGMGYPTILYLDSDGDVVYRHQAIRTIEGFESSAKEAQEFSRLRKGAETGDPDAKLAFIIKQYDSNLIRPEELAPKIKDFTNLSPDSQRQLDELKFELELNDLYRKSNGKPELLAEAAQQILAMYDTKKIPQREKAKDFYYGVLSNYARAKKDITVFEIVIKEMAARAEKDDTKKPQLDSLTRQFDHVKKLVQCESLRKKYTAGDKAVAKELLMLEFEMGITTSATATALLADVGKLTTEEQQLVNDHLYELEFKELTATVKDKESLSEALKRSIEWAKQGRVPQRMDAYQRFWTFIINNAARNGDEEALTLAIAELKKRAATESKLQPMLQSAEVRMRDFIKRKEGASSLPAEKK